MSSVSPRSRPNGEGRGSDLLDGRGGSNTVNVSSCKNVILVSENVQANTAKAPRYCAFFYPWPPIQLSYLHGSTVYYRLYTKDGAIRSINPIYANDEFIGRTLSRLITPPHTALSIKNHLCNIEAFHAGNSSTLIESFLSTVAMEASARVRFKGDSGPGLSQDDPLIFVVEPRGDEKRSLPLGQSALPDSVRHEPRYRVCQHSVCPAIDSHVSAVYYRIYNKGGAIATRMSFDADDEFLGRVNTLSVTPPHTVASLGSRIASAEGVVKSKIQLFEDTDGDALMDDNDQLSLLAQTYPGCAEDDPIAVVCEDEPPSQAGGDVIDDAWWS
jgi:hypothetical protein